MCQLVEHRPATLGIGAAENKIHVEEARRNLGQQNTLLMCGHRRRGCNASNQVHCNSHLGAANVAIACTYQAIEIRNFDNIGIDQTKAAHSEMGQLFGNDRTGTTQANHPNPDASQTLLASGSKHLHLAVEAICFRYPALV